MQGSKVRLSLHLDRGAVLQIVSSDIYAFVGGEVVEDLCASFRWPVAGWAEPLQPCVQCDPHCSNPLTYWISKVIELGSTLHW